MLKAFLILSLISVSATICFSQINQSNFDNTTSKETSTCRKFIENKALGICFYTSDTLTFEQLKNCREVTFKSLLGVKISSFKVTYLLPEIGDIVVLTNLSNKMSDNTIDTILAEKPKSILLEDVMGICGTENILIGSRHIYLKSE
jgi:hypothetical protein